MTFTKVLNKKELKGLSKQDQKAYQKWHAEKIKKNHHLGANETGRFDYLGNR